MTTQAITTAAELLKAATEDFAEMRRGVFQTDDGTRFVLYVNVDTKLATSLERFIQDVIAGVPYLEQIGIERHGRDGRWLMLVKFDREDRGHTAEHVCRWLFNTLWMLEFNPTEFKVAKLRCFGSWLVKQKNPVFFNRPLRPK